jgi:hypothetical protein
MRLGDEQLERSLELIKELIAKRDGENAKVIEGVAKKTRGPRKRLLTPRVFPLASPTPTDNKNDL